MATNKHAQIRYQALNKCFSNFHRRYFIEDLINECSNAIYEFDGIVDGVKRRQIYDDIRYMESEAGWSIPLVRHKEGRRVYYRYEDKEFSINNQPITETEANQLRDTVTLLSRFHGLPQFEWIDEVSVRLESHFDLIPIENKYVSFESNPYLHGLQFFNVLFRAIQNKRVIKVMYQGFRQEQPEQMEVHPYFLKQYNSRWFLLGWNTEYENITNLAIDRIKSLKETQEDYIEKDFDFDEFFDDVLGVTIHDTPIEEIVIRIDNSLWPYVESKPIHGSQAILKKEDDYTLIRLKLKINYELVSTLLSYGDELSVVAPESLIKLLRDKIEKMRLLYNS